MHNKRFCSGSVHFVLIVITLICVIGLIGYFVFLNLIKQHSDYVKDVKLTEVFTSKVVDSGFVLRYPSSRTIKTEKS